MYPAFQDDYPGVKIMSRLPLQSGIIQVHALQNLELALSHASTTKAHWQEVMIQEFSVSMMMMMMMMMVINGYYIMAINDY